MTCAEDTLKAVQNLSKRESRLRFLREMERDLEGVLAKKIPSSDRSSVQSSSGLKMFKDAQTMLRLDMIRSGIQMGTD